MRENVIVGIGVWGLRVCIGRWIIGVHGLMYPMRINAVTKDVTETPKRSTAAKNTGVVFCRKASLHPADLGPIFSRILLST
jgi:hypothetical protein